MRARERSGISRMKTTALLAVIILGVPLFAYGLYLTTHGLNHMNRECSSLQDYFAEFHDPLVVANETYYIYRINGNFTYLINGMGSLQVQAMAFNSTANFILSNPALRTQTEVPPSHPALYFWSLDHGKSWGFIECP